MNIRSEIMKIERELRNLRVSYLDKMKLDPIYLDIQKRKNELIQKCESEGHVKGNFHSNGLGWSWYYCSKCGSRIDIKED